MKFALAKVTKVKALPKHRLALTFADGAEGIFDCTGDLWGEIFEPLKDANFFAKVFIDHGAPSWPNGADLDPGVLRAAIGSTPASRKTVVRRPGPGKPAAVREEQADYFRKKAK